MGRDILCHGPWRGVTPAATIGVRASGPDWWGESFWCSITKLRRSRRFDRLCRKSAVALSVARKAISHRRGYIHDDGDCFKLELRKANGRVGASWSVLYLHGGGGGSINNNT